MLSDVAVAGSTYVIDATFEDEDGNGVTPNASVVWELFQGTTKMAEGSSSPETTPTPTPLVIQGDDLQPTFTSAANVTLDVVVTTYYNSAVGSSNPLVTNEQFECEPAYPYGYTP